MHIVKAALDAFDDRQFALDKIRDRFGGKVGLGAVDVAGEAAQPLFHLRRTVRVVLSATGRALGCSCVHRNTKALIA